MIIPTATYKGHELHQQFPPVGDPHAKGARHFSSVMQIDAIPPSEADARRYSTVFDTVSPATFGDAIDLAMKFGEDIVDGKLQAASL